MKKTNTSLFMLSCSCCPIIKGLQRRRFGRRAERLDPDQLALALEDLEQAIAAAEVPAEKERQAAGEAGVTRKRNINRGVLPPHLPREETSSTSRTRPAPASAASGIASARMCPSGSTCGS
jgi:Transposase C of IS166 homeodomain